MDGFYPAGADHQGYLHRHPNQPSIADNDIPTVERRRRLFPEAHLDKPVLAPRTP